MEYINKLYKEKRIVPDYVRLAIYQKILDQTACVPAGLLSCSLFNYNTNEFYHSCIIRKYQHYSICEPEAQKESRKNRKIEEIRMKRKQHQIEDYEFLSKIRRIEDQLTSLNTKLKSMN